MEGRELQHFFHDHPLILKAEEHKTNGGIDYPEVDINCDGCLLPISGPFYSCGKCRYFLHKVCAELPSALDHPLHPKHPLTLLPRFPSPDGYYKCYFCEKGGSGLVYHCSVCSFNLDFRCAFPTYKINDKCHPHPLTPDLVPIALACHICQVQGKGLFYKCDICQIWVHQNCTTEHSDHDHPYPFRALQHFFHEHALILKAERSKTNGGNEHPKVGIKCNGCQIPISGPFYSCGECPYFFLHKVCAELPRELAHPFHPEHSLTLHHYNNYVYDNYKCRLCKEEGNRVNGSRFVYRCSICSFYVDMKCASPTHEFQDKCHPHPLTPVQVPIAFDCHICLKKEEGLSYKCNICPFWVHQNCTLIPDAVRHSDHMHLLTLLPSVPFEYNMCKNCDICHSKLFMFQCNYSCVGCLFFAHVSCARSETTLSPSTSRDGQNVVLLPMKQDSTELISRLVGNYIDGDANIDNMIADNFFHEHPLSLIDEKTTCDKTCEACAIQISSPSYGCVECDYFLHKCCADLPKQIRHPAHPKHELALRSTPCFIKCSCCSQYCNSIYYECSECGNFSIDIKCGSILEGTVVYHEAHKHPLLIQRRKPSSVCTACGFRIAKLKTLQCNTCSLQLCYRCAMAPAVIKHRYGGKSEEPFILTYSAPENHYDDYLCELCLKELNPKEWYYHCLFGDQFAHVWCMRRIGADSNIKYGKSYIDEKDHEHKLTTVSSTYDCSPCSRCRHPMRTGSTAGVGLECKTCNYRYHLSCLH